MTTIYVPRAFGGTIIYTPPATLPPTKAFSLQASVLPRLSLSFTLKNLLSLVCAEAPLADPNSTIQVTLTAKDITGNPVTSLATLTCVITFPDGSVSTTYSLGSGISNVGSGNYTLAYTTKGPGINSELWTATDTSGNTAQFMNKTPVAY